MSFINKSVNYSLTKYLKTNILLPLLESYNNFLLNKNTLNNNNTFNKDINTGVSLHYLIPNNNIKYFLLVTNKNKLEQVKDNYNIFYFFPDNQSVKTYEDNNNIKNTINDFYLEVDNKFNDEYLFEGYLYKSNDDNDKYHFLLTDILIKNKNVIDLEYNLRYIMLNEILNKCVLKELNNYVTINIHQIFDKYNENLIKVFHDNFIYKNDLCCIENIENFKKQRFLKSIHKNEIETKIIEFGKYTDVYNVYNTNSNNLEGILYIKGINESKQIKKLFKSNCRINLICKYNTNFSKWQPIF